MNEIVQICLFAAKDYIDPLKIREHTTLSQLNKNKIENPHVKAVKNDK